jgi:hypothetical protein
MWNMPDTLAKWKDLFELLSYVVVILGLPAAIYQYRRSKRREEADREYGTYNALDEKYLQFQMLCFEYPHLDLFDVPDATPRELSAVEAKQELIAFTFLISVFERAYLMYHDQSNRVKAAQWTGWDEYIRCYCERQNFRSAWEVSGETFDRNFENYMEEIIRSSGFGKRRARTAAIEEAFPSAKFARITDPEAPEYGRALRLVGQYGWAGGVFNTNELGFLLTRPAGAVTTFAYGFVTDDRALAFTMASWVPNRQLLLIHDFSVVASSLRSSLFTEALNRTLLAISAEGMVPAYLAAELPENEPRHLKTEILETELRANDFSPAEHQYWLLPGFNQRRELVTGRLFVRATTAAPAPFLTVAEWIYREFYGAVIGADANDRLSGAIAEALRRMQRSTA